MNGTKWHWVDPVLRFILGGLFVYSGVVKLADPGAFQLDVLNFELTSPALSGIVAIYLPWLELLCGMALATRSGRDGSLLILCGLMVAFIVLVSSAWARGLDVTCGCFGSSDSAPGYPLWIGRNVLILGALLFLLIPGIRGGAEVPGPGITTPDRFPNG